MPKPRNKQIALSETPFYHLTYRCVRRSFLCGEIDGCNFEHRREWIVERLKLLTEILAVIWYLTHGLLIVLQVVVHARARPVCLVGAYSCNRLVYVTRNPYRDWEPDRKSVV